MEVDSEAAVKRLKRTYAKYFDAPASDEQATVEPGEDGSDMINGAEGWTQVRVSAEVIGRWLLISSCDWLPKNSGVDDLNRLSEK